MRWPAHIRAIVTGREWIQFRCDACGHYQDVSVFGGIAMRELYKLARFYVRAHGHDVAPDAAAV